MLNYDVDMRGLGRASKVWRPCRVEVETPRQCITQLPSNAQRLFRVRARNAGGVSKWSEVSEVFTTDGCEWKGGGGGA